MRQRKKGTVTNTRGTEGERQRKKEREREKENGKESRRKMTEKEAQKFFFWSFFSK